VVALLESDPKSAPTSPKVVQRRDLARLDMPNGRCEVVYVLGVEDRKVVVADPSHDEGRPVLREFVTVLD